MAYSKPWTELELRILREIYPAKGPHAVASLLRREYGAIVKMAHKHGLKYARAKPERASEPKPVPMEKKPCLCCKKTFLPTHKYNFICGSCKSLEVFGGAA